MSKLCGTIIHGLLLIQLVSCSDDRGAGARFGLNDETQIFLTTGGYTLRNVNYAVDDDLNLSITRELRLELFPEVKRRENPEERMFDPTCENELDMPCGRAQTRPLRTGNYLLRYAFVRNGYEDSTRAYRLQSGGEVVVPVTAGRLIADIPYRIRDLDIFGIPHPSPARDPAHPRNPARLELNFKACRVRSRDRCERDGALHVYALRAH